MYKMSMSGRETESSDMDADNAGLCDWIVAKVSQILLEEFHGIIGRITDIMIVQFEDEATISRAGREDGESTSEGNLGVEARLGKIRHTQSLGGSEGGGESDKYDMGARSQEIHEICGKCRATYEFSCHKFRCFKCGERGHVL